MSISVEEREAERVLDHPAGLDQEAEVPSSEKISPIRGCPKLAMSLR